VIHVKGSKGLGDAIYVRAAVLHWLERDEEVTVYTQWPAVFDDLPVTVCPLPNIDPPEMRYVACSVGTDLGEMTKFTASCHKAGIEEPVDLRLGWTVRNQALVDEVLRKAGGRPILVYQALKVAKNDDQRLLRPARGIYNRYVHDRADHFRVRLGQPLYTEDDPLSPRDLDLYGKASITDAFDLGAVGDLWFGESCYVPMLGEAAGKRYAIMFTRRALNSAGRLRNMNPRRLFHRVDLGTAVYDET